MPFLAVMRKAAQRLETARADMWPRWLPLMTFFLALLLYLRTLAPDILPGDVAEFQYLPSRLGLPHTNGFPFYMLVGWLWSHAPVGSLAWRMNVLSALGGAMAVALTTAFCQRLSGRATIALLAGGLLALSPSVWLWSLAAERYTLTLALLIAAFWMAWEGKVVLSSLLLALGIAAHFGAALLVLFWLPYVLWRASAQRRIRRAWLGMGLAAILLLLLYVYVPWRWAAFAQWPLLPGMNLSSAVYRGLVHGWYEPPLRWDTVWHYIAGEAGLMADAGLVAVLRGGWAEAVARIANVLPLWRAEIPWPVALLALPGFLRLLRRDVTLALALGTYAVSATLMVGFVQQAKPGAYLLPAFWVVLLVSAFAVDGVLSAAARARGRLSKMSHLADERVVVSVVGPLLLILLWHRHCDLDLSRRWELRRWWEVTLAHPLEEGAGLVGDWGDVTPLWYLQQAEEWRPDLWGLFPADPEGVIQPWLRTGGPLYLAGPLHDWAASLPEGYGLVPWGNLVRILAPGEGSHCPPFSSSLTTPAAWPLAVSHWEMDQPLTGGRLSTLRLCWRARTRLPINTFLELQLRQPSDALPLNINAPLIVNWYPEDSIPRGTEGLAVMPVRLPLGTPPGTYDAALTAYRLDAEGHWRPWPHVEPISLGQVNVAPSRGFSRAGLTDEVAPLIASGPGPLALRAWRLSDGPVRPGDPVQVDMLWQVRKRPTKPVALQFSFWAWGSRGRLTPAEPIFRSLPLDAWEPGTLLLSTHILRTPRGAGSHTYLLEPHLLLGEERLGWFPARLLTLGTIRVQDRTHSYTPPDGITPTDASFAEAARLAGYTLNRSVLHAGEGLTLTLYWQAEAAVDTSYDVFVHIVGAQGQLVAQHDSPPARGTVPTTLWVSAEIITDPHTIHLPADLPVGTYTLRVGMYNPISGERLPVAGTSATPDRALHLTSIRVTP